AVRAKEFAVVLDFRRDGGRPAAQGQAGGDNDDGSGQVRHGSSSTAGGAGGYGAGDTLVAPLCARPGPPHSPRPHEGRGTKDVGHSTKDYKENRSAAFCPSSFERVETFVRTARLRLASLWLSQVARVMADNCLRVFVLLSLANAERAAAWYLVVALL